MSKTKIAGLTLEAPAGFAREETMVTLRVPADQGFTDERTSTPVRPNLVIHRRPRRDEADLAHVVAKVRAELQTSIPALSNVDASDFRFADGETGVLLAYAMPAPKGLELVQLHALRLDDDTITSLTISTERDHLTDELKGSYLRALASASPA